MIGVGERSIGFVQDYCTCNTTYDIDHLYIVNHKGCDLLRNSTHELCTGVLSSFYENSTHICIDKPYVSTGKPFLVGCVIGIVSIVLITMLVFISKLKHAGLV